jgi:hypothetical protein
MWTAVMMSCSCVALETGIFQAKTTDRCNADVDAAPKIAKLRNAEKPSLKIEQLT